MATNAALELLKKDHANRLAAVNRKTKSDRMEAMFYRKGAGMLTAATYGTLNRLDVSVSVGWFPWKLAVTALALGVEATTGGKVQAAAAGIGEATNAIYIKDSITENTLIVGEAAPSGYIHGDSVHDAVDHVSTPHTDHVAAVADGGEM